MIVPVVLTGAVLALLYRSRVVPPPATDVTPPPAGGAPPLQLPTTPSGTPANVPTATALPPALQDQVNTLMGMGEAAPPAELHALANRIAAVAPQNEAVTFLRSLAEQNLAGVTRTSPTRVQGLPPYHGIGVNADAFRPFSYVAPVAAPAVQNAPIPVQSAPFTSAASAPPATAPSGADTFRCVDPEGCALFRTPAPLYPIGVSVPGGGTVTALQRSGDFLEVRYQNTRGWLPMRALAQVTPGAGVRLGSIFSR